MNRTPTQTSEWVKRMDLPRPDEDNIAGLIASVVIVFFAGIALFNLANYPNISASAVLLSVSWLLIVSIGLLLFASGIFEQGARQFAIVRMATLSRDHFVECRNENSFNQIVCFGFTLFKRPYIQLQIPASDIESIEWSSGQGTSLAGRDMDDWTVTVRYCRQGAHRGIATDDRKRGLHIVGPSGPRSETALTAHALIAFLESTGIVFYPTSNEFIFTTQEPETPKSP